VDEVAIVDEILKIFAQPHKALTMVEKQMEVFDIAQHQLPLLFEPNALRLRRATMNDLMTLYNWTNDPDVRLNSFDSNPIPLDAHTHWLAQKLQDENTVLFILHSDTLEFGVIRFTRQNEEATIHFSIATEHRGKGLGKKIIALGEQLVQSHWPQIRRFIALVKTENQASLKSFENYQRAELNDHLVLTKEIH
jgi:RimJ/RimL family protein N-acetyltransferase